MFHSITSTEKKEKIMKDLKRADGRIRVVVATSALSMGVNISGMYRPFLVFEYLKPSLLSLKLHRAELETASVVKIPQ